jgi:L-fucose isomerase-like protein
VASAIHDEKTWKTLFNQYETGLTSKGCTLLPTTTDTVRVFWAATGGTERLMLDELRKSSQPAIIVAHPSHNSLPASLETLARVHQEGEKGRVVYLKGPEDEAGIAELKRTVRMVGAHAEMKKARIGIIGEPSDWLVASCPDSKKVHDRWGPTIIPLPLDDALSQIQQDKRDYNSEAKAMISKAKETVGAGEKDIEYASRVQPALHQIIQKFSLDACTVRCFDIVKLLSTSGCLALSDLNDAGIIAGYVG